jgi:hypothetical protein
MLGSIPLAFDGNPILILPHIVAGAVTIGVRATQHSRGGPQMLKPLTHFRRNVRELPPVHCNGSGRAKSDAIIDPALRFLGSKADKEYIRSKCLRNMNFQIVIAIAMRPSSRSTRSSAHALKIFVAALAASQVTL